MQNEFNTTHKYKSFLERFLSILEQKQQPPEETINEWKLRYIASQVSIWDYFGIPQVKYLALDKNEKSRMFPEYYNKLVLKYFSGKKIYFFCCCLLFSDVCHVSDVWLVSGFSDMFFFWQFSR